MAADAADEILDTRRVDDELRKILAVFGPERFLHGPIVDCSALAEQLRGGELGVLESGFRALALAVGRGLPELRFELIDERPVTRADEPASRGDEADFELTSWCAESKTACYSVRCTDTQPLLTLAAIGMELARLFLLQVLSELEAGRLPDVAPRADAQHDPYRAGVVDVDGALGEVSLSSVECYLGMGYLALQGSQCVRHGGETLGAWTSMHWSIQSVGDLSMPEIAHLNALQSLLRRDAPHSGQPALPPNQARVYRACCDRISGREQEYSAILGLDFGDLQPRGLPVRATPSVPVVVVVPGVEAGGAGKFNAGLPVFRVRQTKLAAYAGRSIFAMAIIIAIAVGTAPALWAHLMAMTMAALVVVFTMALLGRSQRADRCSDPDCGAVIAVDAPKCERCGGQVRGEIASAKQRLDAEHELEKSDVHGSSRAPG